MAPLCQSSMAVTLVTAYCNCYLAGQVALQEEESDAQVAATSVCQACGETGQPHALGQTLGRRRAPGQAAASGLVAVKAGAKDQTAKAAPSARQGWSFLAAATASVE
eukprot:CAMPEP_0197663846 /NCGR_PEP_ID=MMETSP1338-20131121/58269_1 /TAXON_ID=43686 ORGANISM="Pelagodinium beii, Strain RCC1491" /NCGR_SAMPLE_ID=MMETSP1338 /ASSEMBLY_ACC=CAM_ASM_000754 /LENGTH=106 /DNA_ID=CAMNT_0043242355 /DNA_START=191 /DNA_END=511 /DNA_ORIENTATION=-